MSAPNASNPDHPNAALSPNVSLATIPVAESFFAWLRVSLLSFGGPAAQIAVMHRIIVDEKKWLNERRFLHALNFCMLLPGPEAQQLATYIGWLMHGIRGGLMAGLLFILPGFVSMLALSVLYVSFLDSTAIQSLFFGLRCAVLAIVAEAVLRVSRRVLKNRVLKLISVIAFLLMWLKLLPFPAVIALAGIVGLLGHKAAPSVFCLTRWNDDSDAAANVPGSSRGALGEVGRSLMIAVTCLVLWFSPLLLAAHFAGNDSVYVKSSLFFSKAAVVTFGGAYSVLSYVDQKAVDDYRWLEKGEMADGLGLAETTPGPLIMVVQFVGFLAAWRHGTELPPLIAGTLGAVLTTWVTFVPCFLWIFLGAPWIEKLLHKRWLSTALTAITASVVGVIATLGVNMAVATLFSKQSSLTLGGMTLAVPVWSSIQPAACGITLVAMILTLVLHRSLPVTLVTCVVLGLLLRITGLAPL